MRPTFSGLTSRARAGRLSRGPKCKHGLRSPRPTLLLIDDSAAQQNLYKVALETEFNILTAARGAEGLAVAVRARPDAIVLDVLMPGMDGWETRTHIKCNSITAGIPVILLTAADDCDLSRHAMAVGPSALLPQAVSRRYAARHRPRGGARVR